MASSTKPIPKTMLAWTYTPSKTVQLSTLPTPGPPTGSQVLIHVSHVALNFATEEIGKLASLPLLGRILPAFGHGSWVAEFEFSGTVAAAGPDAQRILHEDQSDPSHGDFSVGVPVNGYVSFSQLLTGRGAMAEYILIPAVQLSPVQHVVGSLSGQALDHKMAEASGLTGVTQVVIRFGDESKVKNGDLVLVNGAGGGVGGVGVQMLRALGARVAGVCSGGSAERVVGLGAEDVLDYTKFAGPKALGEEIERKYGKSFDVVLDCVGIKALYDTSDKWLKEDGRYVNVGNLEGGLFWWKFWSTRAPVWAGGGKRQLVMIGHIPNPTTQRRAITMWEKGEIKVPVDSIWKMEDGKKGYEKVATKRARGKVVIKLRDLAE